MGHRHRRHPLTHPVGIGDAVNGGARDGPDAVDQARHQARLVVDGGLRRPLRFDRAARPRRSRPRPASRSDRRTRQGPRAARSAGCRSPISPVTRPRRTAPCRPAARRGAPPCPHSTPRWGPKNLYDEHTRKSQPSACTSMHWCGASCTASTQVMAPAERASAVRAATSLIDPVRLLAAFSARRRVRGPSRGSRSSGSIFQVSRLNGSHRIDEVEVFREQQPRRHVALVIHSGHDDLVARR